MAEKKITELDAASGVTADDLVPIVNDPAGTPATQRATAAQLLAYIESAIGTAAFRALLDDATAAAQRTTLGLGTAATADTGTGAANVPTITQADARYQPLDSDLTAIAALATTSYGRALLTLADAAALRSTAGLGSLATASSVTASQVSDASADGRSLITAADYAAMRALLGLVIGTNVQAQDAELSALAGLVSAANQLPYFTGSGAAALTTLSAYIRTLLDDADAATARGTLGLGGAATLSVGTTSGTVAAGDDSRLSDARTPTAHQSNHQSGGSDALSGNLDANARIGVEKAGTLISTRRRINFIDGASVSITVVDDPGNEEADITIAAGTIPIETAQRLPLVTNVFTAGVTPPVSAITPIGDGNASQTTADLTGMTECRLVFGSSWQSGGGDPVLAAQYQLDSGSWAYLDGSAGPSASLAGGGYDQIQDSGWVTITPAARAVVRLRLVARNGDGTTGYNFNGPVLWARGPALGTAVATPEQAFAYALILGG